MLSSSRLYAYQAFPLPFNCPAMSRSTCKHVGSFDSFQLANSEPESLSSSVPALARNTTCELSILDSLPMARGWASRCLDSHSGWPGPQYSIHHCNLTSTKLQGVPLERTQRISHCSFASSMPGRKRHAKSFKSQRTIHTVSARLSRWARPATRKLRG